MNPLFPDEPSSANAHHQAGYVLSRQDKHLDPLSDQEKEGASPAVELIRRKIDALYASEPDAKQELREAQPAPLQRSQHQEFMNGLSSSGKSLAEIQAAWHAYYLNLPDHEKRQVWQEFYAGSRRQLRRAVHPARVSPVRLPAQPAPPSSPEPTQAVVVVNHETMPAMPNSDHRSLAAVKKQVLKNVRSRSLAQVKAKEHLQSLAFGLGIGALVLLIALFGFFNEIVIAPFIHPGGHAEATPIILSTDGIAPTDKNEVIIPKINVELPYITGSSTKESDIETQLEDGVAHYPTTATPGQQGNTAFFGHSSNNIFNKGKYKFAFVLLHELEPGDIFYITAGGKVYTYKVFQKKVVEPSEIWVLNPVEGKTATAALITCDPPGTSLHRLVVWGEQVNPDPGDNIIAPAPANLEPPKELPSNSPTLWSRFYHWATPW